MAQLSEDYLKCRQENPQNIQNAINYILILLGIKADSVEQHERDLQIAVLIDFIRDRFGQLTIEEIKHAFKMYVAGDLGIKTFRLLDSISASDVLNAYLDIRAERLRNYDSKKQVLQLPEFTDNAKKEIIDSGIVRIFEEFKQNGDFGSNAIEYVFDQLVEYELIKLPKNKDSSLGKWYALQEEKAKSIIVLQAKKNESASNAKQIIKDAIENNSALVDIKTKEIVLTQYFDKLISDKKEISDVLKDK